MQGDVGPLQASGPGVYPQANYEGIGLVRFDSASDSAQDV